MNEVDWQMVYQRYWSDNVNDMDRQRRKQAEFLIHQSCPWAVIEEIGVLNTGMKARVEGILNAFDVGLHKVVNVRAGWYY